LICPSRFWHARTLRSIARPPESKGNDVSTSLASRATLNANGWRGAVRAYAQGERFHMGVSKRDEATASR
jgi:hypothetical protein